VVALDGVEMKTHITFVLDSSGSMSAIEDDTKGGFNTFLDDQKDEEGEATVSLYDFNTNVEQVYRGRAVEHAPKLTDDTYSPGGRTALHDAISTAITETAADLSGMNAENRPDNVIVVILTDGKENASETPQERVREQVKYRREEFDWEFLFIGANQDAALTASEMGMHKDKSLNMSHNAEGTQAAYESTSERVSELRQEGSIDGFDEEDRKRQENARDS
jgi:Mg-chelatase subunit ChlD